MNNKNRRCRSLLLLLLLLLLSLAVGAAAAEEKKEEKEEEAEEEEEEDEDTAGGAALTAESTKPSPTSSRSRIARMPLCMVLMMRSASSSSLRSESSAFISARILASPGEELDGAVLPEQEIDRVLHHRGCLGVIFLDLQHSRDVLLDIGLGG